MTEVESELARTKTLLSRFMPEASNRDHVDFSDPVPEASDLPALQLQGDTDNSVPDIAPAYAPAAAIGPENSAPSHAIQHASESQQFASQSPAHSPKRSHVQTALPLETPPHSNSFEWDERAGRGPDKFVDGMASLTSAANEGGYLGRISLFLKFRLNLTIHRCGIWSRLAKDN